ncbi:MAG TPA: ABC-F family ATP-binding cassette domain-containing protein [Syntrophales bacterium]|nr:ABC-F family ATP-binding cassette domain-containing protein [Syntrophales bacterium]HPC31625.1 ABC-F family ATP-binding cassette domain-containing protein [Syntrophales bacterium]HQJ30720.1 ABC-F family ATP-binding cassette domain-containing protein [Syntrophales bacterium]HRR48221.1 ABC-F family ATP-binding cassette domain-containing protein [Syntrophales bacterium]HRU87862.1 ABC-F family ATP-binding cassette domain-containing protein [Syntrophales bacterium]
MIYLKDITLAFGAKTIFAGISWNITERSRIGLVGDNGAGKTTLLKAIRGDVELDGGAIEIADRKNKTLAYLPQDLEELPPVPLMDYLRRHCGLAALENTIRECERQIAAGTCCLSAAAAPAAEMEETAAAYRQLLKDYETSLARFHARDGYTFEARARQILKGFGFREQDFHRNCGEFSGGWKMRILLSAILLSQPDIMLLDEPTNHLDTESMEWLESYLKDYPGTMIAVAHDRFFLDKLATTIAEISRGSLTIYRGNYSWYLREKERRRAALEKERLLQQGEIRRTETFVARFRYQATKAKQVQSRLRFLEKFTPLQAEAQEKTVRIQFPVGPKSGKEVLTVCNLSKDYGDGDIFRAVSFTLHRGERVAIVGMNGAGKSTLARLLGGVEAPSAGEIQYGLQVQPAFFSQESAENLLYERTVWEEARDVPSHFNDQERRNLLGAFLFSGDDIHKPVTVLSGGEKSRLALLKILLQKTNLLVLDEPTNHLDLKTKDIFQEALLAYHGTVVLVSHDRYFLDRLVNRVFELRDGRCSEYLGNYSDFIEKRQAMAAAGDPEGWPNGRSGKGAAVPATAKATATAGYPRERGTLAATPAAGPGSSSGTAPGEERANHDPAAVVKAVRTREERRREAEERNRLARQRRGWQKDLQTVEAEIAVREERKAAGETFLCDPGSHREPDRIRQTVRELRELEKEIAALYDRWQELADHLERG